MTEHSWRIRQWNKYSDTAPTDIEPTSDWLSKLVRIRIGDAGVLQGDLLEHIHDTYLEMSLCSSCPSYKDVLFTFLKPPLAKTAKHQNC